MAQRHDLQVLLESLLGSRNVYFQPPESITMHYPCIVYHRDDEHLRHADNKPYDRRKKYQIVVIDPNVDSLIPDKIAQLPFCTYERFHTADNLNHDTYNLFF